MSAEPQRAPWVGPPPNSGSIARCWRMALKLDARELGMTAREAPGCEDDGHPPRCGWDHVFARLRQKLVDRVCEHVDEGGELADLRLPGIPMREINAAYQEVYGG